MYRTETDASLSARAQSVWQSRFMSLMSNAPRTTNLPSSIRWLSGDKDKTTQAVAELSEYPKVRSTASTLFSQFMISTLPKTVPEMSGLPLKKPLSRGAMLEKSNKIGMEAKTWMTGQLLKTVCTETRIVYVKLVRVHKQPLYSSIFSKQRDQ